MQLVAGIAGAVVGSFIPGVGPALGPALGSAAFGPLVPMSGTNSKSSENHEHSLPVRIEEPCVDLR